MCLQSEDVEEEFSSSAGDPSSTEVSQTVTFIDNDVGVCVGAPVAHNVVASVDSTDDLSLGKFLERPTLIDTSSWATSELPGVKLALKPWYLFLNNTLIKKKLDNYAFMRGRLHVKVLVNGTPFQYGLLRVCSSPLLGWVSDKIRTNVGVANSALVPYSQQPGFVVSPQANAGGEITLPFFLHKNWMDITSATEVQNMGTLTYVIYSALRVAVSGGSTAVTLRTYAWMTDVELMGSTTKLSLQGRDEYGQGIVSAPASALAAGASYLTKIPIIGKFARATQIGANATSAIATLFGYTNVPVISDVVGYQPMNAPMLASSHIGTPIQKLTLDPKQELSIDPTPHGLASHDELAMSNLLKKESLFATTSWATSDTASTLLFVCRANPYLPFQLDIPNSLLANVGKRVWHIPLSYIGAMFKHWRGDLIFRIKVVATKFHKGRLKVSYDPINDISSTDVPENAAYTQIIDIGEDDDIEIRIPYHQALAWLRNDQTIQDNYTTGGALAPRAGVDNGSFTLRVLNTLTAPSTSTVDILFYVRAADSFEYANPNNHIGPDGNNAVPSFFALQGQDTVDLEPRQISMGNPSAVRTERYGLNFGECVGSLRNILHRYMVADTVSVTNVAASSLAPIYKSYKRMPYTPGYQPGSFATSANKIIAASGTANFAFNTMTHVPYITGLFLGYRGSVNYAITPSMDLQGEISDIRVTRSTNSNSFTQVSRYYATQTAVTTGNTISVRANNINRLNYIEDGLAGMAITSTATNNSVTFNLPDYNHFNFSLVDPSFYNNGSSSDGTDEQSALLRILFKTSASVNIDGQTIQTEMAAGPDFTTLYFLCCPTLDYSTSTPTPV